MAFVTSLPIFSNSTFSSWSSSSSLSSLHRNHAPLPKRRPLSSSSPFSPMHMDLPGSGIYAPDVNKSQIRVIIFGATGYIGRFVTFEFVRRGFDVIAFSRSRSGVGGRQDEEAVRTDLKGARVMFGDVTDRDDIANFYRSLSSSSKNDNDDDVEKPLSTIVVSCLASRSGGIGDSNAIDYEATLNTLIEGRKHGNVSHFILLSAICVQKPELEFQRAKLRFEAHLQSEADNDPQFSFTIVRPTAFFKSLAGQIERVKKGAAFVMFGQGDLCKCNALSERDLASFMVECAYDESKRNQILPIGGPGKPITPKEQAEMLFKLVDKKPKYIRLPIGTMDFAIGLLDLIAKIFPGAKDAAEFGRIGKYYAVEDMVGPSYGNDTLEQFFEKAIQDGGLDGQDLGDAAIF